MADDHSKKTSDSSFNLFNSNFPNCRRIVFKSFVILTLSLLYMRHEKRKLLKISSQKSIFYSYNEKAKTNPQDIALAIKAFVIGTGVSVGLVGMGVGIGGRFLRVDNIQEFWTKMCEWGGGHDFKDKTKLIKAEEELKNAFDKTFPKEGKP